MATAPDVKFPRVIILGTRGRDVIGHKRAISRARPDLYPWQDFSDYSGEYFVDAFVMWKKSKGLGTAPQIGGVAHNVLERVHAKNKPDEWAFDARAIQLCQEAWDSITKTPEDRIREAIVAAGFFWYAHRGAIAYSQARPMQLGKPPWVADRWDCSAFVTNCHFAGGAPDPNGRGYDHLGYTGTLMSRGARADSVNDLEPGDLIFYGYTNSPSPAFNVGDPTHVALYIGLHEGTKSVLSLGHYPMELYRYGYRSINHFRHYNVVPQV